MFTMAIPLVPLFIVLLLVAYKLYQRFRYKLPPGPRPWPIVGNLFQVKPVRYRCFADWAKVYGPIMSVWVGPNLNVIVSNSQLAREVLQEHDQKLADRHRSRATAKFSRNGQDMVWADYGPHYVKLRKFCTVELFSQKRIEALRPIRENEITSMAESIFKDCTNPEKSGKSLEIKKYLGTVVFNNITRIVFGKKFVNLEGVMDEQGLEFKAIMANEFKLAGSVMLGEFFPWLRWMKPLDEEAFAKHEARRDRLTRAIFEEHKLARQRNEGATKQHFVDALLNWQDKYEFSEDTVVGLLWDMILAGMDTVAIVTEWSMAEMIKNPRVQQKVQEELDRVVGTERVMTESDIPNLPYLQCVVKECLRLHPSTPLMLPHCASEDVKVGGYDIPKGTTVIVNVWAIARDPAFWKDPLEFRPERFLEEDVDVKGHDFRLLPFGAGRRVCAGAQIAIYMVTSLLGHLLHQFSWAPPDDLKPNEIDMSDNPGMITYMKTPLHGVPTPRLSSHLYKPVGADF